MTPQLFPQLQTILAFALSVAAKIPDKGLSLRLQEPHQGWSA